MGYLKDEVRARLEGQNERQVLRDAARAHRGKITRILQFRRDGHLDELGLAKSNLLHIGCLWKEWTRYGVTILTTDTGVVLPYRPDGMLDWESYAKRRRRYPELQMAAEQEPLFSGESSA